MIELAIGIAGSLLALWFVLRALRRRRVDDRDWLPAELRAARLIYAERLFRSSGPVRVSAKVDRAYRDRAGVVVLVELKTRRADKVHLSDVIELSAQRRFDGTFWRDRRHAWLCHCPACRPKAPKDPSGRIV